jgi:CHAD domain-containing protein
VGEEVSADSRYTNASLAEHPYSKWRGEPETKYHWKADESVADGLRRMLSEQLQCAVWHLSQSAESTDEAVHEARKALKKARSAMRLLQSVLGSQFGKENAALRDVGRKLSPVRDAQALIEMFDELNGKYREEVGDRSLASVRDGLVARRQALSREFQGKHLRGTVLKSLRESAARVEQWDLEALDFPALSRGFARTIRRNRVACRDAYGESTPEAFHEWRKRAKDLRYHFGLMAKAWPPVLGGFEDAARELESKLGDDHNLVLMRNTIVEKPARFGKQKDIKAFLEIVDEHQQELRWEAKILAQRLYAGKPRRWRRQLKTYWSVWKQEKDG